MSKYLDGDLNRIPEATEALRLANEFPCIILYRPANKKKKRQTDDDSFYGYTTFDPEYILSSLDCE